VAVDVAAPNTGETRARPLWPTHLVALPARLVLTGIVGISFAIRLAASFGHVIPLYFPDEYIYSSIARSLADSGRPLIRGGPAHFPALLEPILAAPFWLLHDPVAAYRLTQAEQSLAMSLAAVPAYLLARRIGLGKGFALACAAIAVTCPDLMYVSFVIADPIAYPLALGAIYAGVCALDRPSRRGQIAFLALAGLATFARVQYVFLPIAFLAASLVVERGRIRAAVRSVRFTALLMAVPLLAVLALGPSRMLGYYSSIGRLHVGLGFLHWIANDAMLIAYASGWILVPGAIVGVALVLWKPASRAEAAFGGLVGATLVALFVEAGLYASNGAERFQERYLFLLLPLVAPAFGLCMQRVGAGRRAVPLLAFGLLLLSARVPISGYTVSDSKQDSPFLFAVFKLEKIIDVGNGSLTVAILAALLSVAACAVALAPRRRAATAAAFALSIGVLVAVSAASVSFDNENTRMIQASFLGGDVSWVDHSALGPVDVVQTDGTPSERTLEQLFWNTSLRRVLLLGGAEPIDAFASERLGVTRDGRLLVGGQVDRRPLLVSSYATQTQLAGVTRVGVAPTFTLYRPSGTPRLSVVSAGLYSDGWLASDGRITIWQPTVRTRGTLTLRLSLPKGPGSMTLRLRGPGVRRSVTVRSAGHRTVVLPVRAKGPWVLHFRATEPARLGDGRAISMKARQPQFTARP
jgi:hypothetical protein